MLQMLSIPTWFLTLSAADLHWPEMIQAVVLPFGKKLTQKDVQKMSIKDRGTNFCQNPITGVWMFQHRLVAFFSEYLLSDTHPLGHITDYMIKIEFQMRGSPHAHCLLWVKDAPKIDKDPDDAMCAFIDKYIRAAIPPVTSIMNIRSNLRTTYRNIHILTTVTETNHAVLVFQNHLQQKHSYLDHL